MVSKIVFTDRFSNILFLVNGIAVLLFLAAKQKKEQRAMKFGNYETLKRVAGGNFLKSSNVLLLLRILGLTLLIVGISNPVLISEEPSGNSDYVIAIDTSSSMLTSDIEPTRFQAAKDVSRQFVSRLGNNTRAGIVSFSGRVKKEQQLTSDKELLAATIKNISTGETAGTAIGDALITSSSMLLSSERNRTVILITDGRNNVGTSLNESLDYVMNHNVTVNTVGLGTDNSSRQEFGIVNRTNASQADFPGLDQEGLKRIANATGGEFVLATNRADLEEAISSMNLVTVRQDISRYLIYVALVFLLGEWVLGSTRYSIIP
ncbi:MAG: VWA domain-containing protein [Candidatus Nanohaloarchaea archaeon]